MTTPTPGQPLSEADVSLLPCPFCGAPGEFTPHQEVTGMIIAGCSDGDCLGHCAAYDFVDREHAAAAWNRRPHAPVSRPGDGVEWERDMSGETFAGFRVAAWRYRQAGETDKLPHHYAEHWSTPGASAWGIQRLFTEDQLLAALTPPAEPVSRPAGEGEREAVALSDLRTIKSWLVGLSTSPDLNDVVADGGVTVGMCYQQEAREFAGRIDRAISLLSPAAPDAGGGERPHIFLDCDGVLADFDTYAESYFGMNPREYEKRMGSEKFWRELEAKGDFYRNLPLMPDALALYEGVKHLNPTILTGCPRGNWAEAQKVAWAHEHFPGVPVITCRSSDKRAHAKPGDVLIDDWPQHRHRWVEHGGIFISHFDAETSLATLWAHYPALQPGGER